MKRSEKERAAWAQIQERVNARGNARAERLARRRRNHKRWLMQRPESPDVIARREESLRLKRERESIIGQPNSPYEIAVAIVEAESGVSRKGREHALKHPNNVRVNEIALEVVRNAALNDHSSDQSTEEAA